MFLCSRKLTNPCATLLEEGANGQMTKLVCPFPRIHISTEACTYYQNDEKLSEEILRQIDGALKKPEETTGKQFGNPKILLVSVRSARTSMRNMDHPQPGLNDEVVAGLAEATGNPRFA